MKIQQSKLFLRVSLLVCSVYATLSQGRSQSITSRLPDLEWTRDYAIPYTTAKQSPVQPKIHQQMNLSPRFLPTLQAAFPQRQWFWKDGGKFGSVGHVAQTFLGVPGRSWDLGGSAWLDENRYVTEEGCVPHDCPDRGMLWVDTAPDSSAVIFTLTQGVPVSAVGDTHVWIFVSSAKLGNTLPSAYQSSVRRWYGENAADGYKQKVLLATVVSPNGAMRDIPLEDLTGKAAGAMQ